MIITLAGFPGAGKSTVKSMLADRLGYKKYSAGDIRGKMATDRGMTIDEFNKLGLTESFTDKDVDAFQTELGKKEDDFVIDGRVSWHFIPQSVKVLLVVDPKVSAARIYADRKGNPSRKDEPEYGSVEEAEAVLHDRTESDRARYRKWYGLDFMDRTNYDLVIDTTRKTPETVVNDILAFIEARKA